MNRIASLLEDKTIFITGATGFLGQPIVEKILWLNPNVRRIYVLIRPKRSGSRSLTAEQRLEKELYQSSVFERLRAIHGDGLPALLRNKLLAVPGDISTDRLGIPEELLAQLQDEVDIVINSAAVVSFDAPIDQALELNVLGASRVAEFANSCKKAILIHVSTAYVNGSRTDSIPETLYHSAEDSDDAGPFPVRAFRNPRSDIEFIQNLVEKVKEESRSPEIERQMKQALIKRRRSSKTGKNPRRREQIETFRKRWLEARLIQEGMKWARTRGWNDTYTYTKAMGEQMVTRLRNGRQTVIIRPSIIESSLSEPIPGWLDGLRMADPLITAIGKGRLKALPLDPDVVLDLVPVDMVVNVLLASLLEVSSASPLRIFQIATGALNPITLGELNELIFRYFQRNPMLDRTGRPILIKRLRFPRPSTFRLQHRLKSVPLDTVERTLDTLSRLGLSFKYRKRISATRAAHEKLYYYGEIYEPYLNLNCRFQITNSLRLFASLKPAERETLNFDVTRLNWRHYIQNTHIPGVKKYILKMEGAEPGIEERSRPECPDSCTVHELINRSAELYSGKVALQIKRDGQWQRFTYAQVKERADHVAELLLSLGFQKGERIILYSENQPEWGLAYLGAAELGLIVVPLDSQTWVREVWSIARFVEARGIMASEACFRSFTPELLSQEMPKTGPVHLLNVNDRCRPFVGAGCSEASPAVVERVIDSEPAYSAEKRSVRGSDEAGSDSPIRNPQSAIERPVVGPDDPASIIFTMGTPVDPRGAVHTHRNFLTNLSAVRRFLPLSEDDRMLSVLPLYHALEFTCGFLSPLAVGANVTYMKSLKPKAILDTMRETQTSVLLGVPTLYSLIREDVERRVLGTAKSAVKSNWMSTTKQVSHSVEKTLGRNVGRHLFAKVHEEFGGNVRFFVSGGSALGPGLYDDFKALGLPIYEGYGLTETAPVLTVNPLHQSRRGSAGRALPGVELRIHRPDRDGIGEIIVKTPSLMKGYFKNRAASAEVMREGWFHTGDLGWIDEEGYLYITGRLKDVIVTGAGKNVYPSDLEAIYKSSIPMIGEVCVLGIRNQLTEDVHAVIHPDPEATQAVSGDLKKAVQKEIQKLAKELPSYHRFQHVHIWSSPLPRHDNGKIDRPQIRRELERQIQRAAAGGGESNEVAQTADLETALLNELGRLCNRPVSEISGESNLYSELGLDSLMAIELLLLIENRFGVVISDEKASAFQTVNDVLREIQESKAQARMVPGRGSAERMRSALPYSERSALNRFLLGMSFVSMKMLYQNYFDLQLGNPELLPRNASYIIAANHASHLDTGAIISALGAALGLREAQKLHVLGARDYFFDTPWKSWFFSTFLNVVPIEREEASLAGLRMVKAILKEREPILIFPEGTRTRTGRLQGFKPGLGLLAWELHVPIVPAYIGGTGQAMPVGTLLPRRNKVVVTFGPPILMGRYASNGGAGTGASSDELYRTIVSDVRAEIERLAGDSARR